MKKITKYSLIAILLTCISITACQKEKPKNNIPPLRTFKTPFIGPPEISEIIKLYGVENETLTIPGKFSSTAEENIVTIGGINAKVTNIIAPGTIFDYLTVIIPPGLKAGYNDITVEVNKQTANFSNFILLNKHDVEQIRAFFNQQSGDKLNAELISQKIKDFDVNKIYTWHLVAEFDNYGRLQAFKLPEEDKITGALNLKNCSYLNGVIVPNCRLTTMDLTGSNKLMLLNCSGNKLTTIKLSEGTKLIESAYASLESLMNPQKNGIQDVTPTYIKK